MPNIMYNIIIAANAEENDMDNNSIIVLDYFRTNLDKNIIDLSEITNKFLVIKAIKDLIYYENISYQYKINNINLLKNMFIEYSDNFWDAELWLRYLEQDFPEWEHYHMITSILNKHEYKYSVMVSIINQFHDDIIRNNLSILFINSCDNSYSLAKWFIISGLNYDEIRQRAIKLNDIESFISGINTAKKRYEPEYGRKDFFDNLPDDFKLGIMI